MDLEKMLEKKALEDSYKYEPVYRALFRETDRVDFSYLDELEDRYLDETYVSPKSNTGKIKHVKNELELHEDLYLGKIMYISKILEELGVENREFLEASDRAKNLFIMYNTVLPLKIVAPFMKFGVDRDDLIQEGTIKLMISADKYDYRMGYKFITYASWWVKQGMREFVHNNSKTIRRPTHIITEINKMNQASNVLSQDLNREPTPEEVSYLSGITVERIHKLKQIAQDTVSYHALNAQNDDFNYENLISDNFDLENSIIEDSVKLAIEKAISTLTKREAKIVRLRFGLDDGIPMTLEEVGNIVNLTKERVRQIESKALRNLRHPTRRKYLKDYF